MIFTDAIFPVNISYGSSGGPYIPTSMVRLRSGAVHSNQPWQAPMRRYDASVGIREEYELQQVVEFWEAHRGPLYGFRWKDWSDYKSGSAYDPITPTDQIIGTGDGISRIFPITKKYGTGSVAAYRRITKPKNLSVIVAVGGLLVTNYVVDYGMGLIIFNTAPANGATVTCGYEFEVPCHFSSETLAVRLDHWNASSISAIDVEEIRIPDVPESLYPYILLGYTASELMQFANFLEYAVNVVYPEYDNQ